MTRSARTFCLLCSALIGVANFQMEASLAADAAADASPIIKTVKTDGTGDFKTIQEAVDNVPTANSTRHIIAIYPGRYDERIIIKGKPQVTFRGMGDGKGDVWIGGDLATTDTALLWVNSEDFRCENLTLEIPTLIPDIVNLRPTVRVDKPRVVFESCAIKGLRNTLRVKEQSYYHFCSIAGTTDFIYGNGTAVFDACDIVRIDAKEGAMTAPDTAKEREFGLVFLQCRIVKGSERMLRKCALMRPWGEAGHTAFIECEMGDFISPAAWQAWQGRETTCRAEEYGSVTPDMQAIDLSQRASWVRRLNAEEASRYTLKNIFGEWDPHASSPHDPKQK